MKEPNSLQQQFLESYDALSDAIFKHCFFRVSNREVALDLMQDTFLKTWKYLQEGKDIHDVRAFLYKVANNLIIDYYRKKKAVSLEEIIEGSEDRFQPSDDSYKDILSKAELERVMVFIRSLEEPYRQAITMRYIDGLSPQDIAEIVGESANNISVRITRALEKIREQMN